MHVDGPTEDVSLRAKAIIKWTASSSSSSHNKSCHVVLVDNGRSLDAYGTIDYLFGVIAMHVSVIYFLKENTRILYGRSYVTIRKTPGFCMVEAIAPLGKHKDSVW